MLLRYTAVCHAAQVHNFLPLCSGTQLFAMLLRYTAVCHAAQVESYLPGCSGPCTQLFVSLKIFKFALNFSQNRLRSKSILELFIKAQFGQVSAKINNSRNLSFSSSYIGRIGDAIITAKFLRIFSWLFPALSGRSTRRGSSPSSTSSSRRRRSTYHTCNICISHSSTSNRLSNVWFFSFFLFSKCKDRRCFKKVSTDFLSRHWNVNILCVCKITFSAKFFREEISKSLYI